MTKQLKPIPDFASEADERAFWESPENDSTEYVDWSKAKLTRCISTLEKEVGEPELGYDEWFRAGVEEALADTSPGIPHEQVMKEFHATIRKLASNPVPR